MIDLENVVVLWSERIIPLVEELHGLDVMDTEEREKAEARSQKAEISRKLLELADLLDLMSQLVRNEYWFMKGKGVDIQVGIYDE